MGGLAAPCGVRPAHYVDEVRSRPAAILPRTNRAQASQKHPAVARDADAAPPIRLPGKTRIKNADKLREAICFASDMKVDPGRLVAAERLLRGLQLQLAKEESAAAVTLIHGPVLGGVRRFFTPKCTHEPKCIKTVSCTLRKIEELANVNATLLPMLLQLP